MRYLRQSTSVDVGIGPFLDSTDGVTPKTGLTITQPDIRLKKNGGAWAQKNAAQTLSHEENGWYEVTLDATDTNTLGVLMLAVAEAGALQVWHEFMVVPANVWDSWFGSDLQQVDVAQFGNANGTFASGRPEVNTTHAAGTAWGSGAITAAAIATDAITAAKIAANAIGSSEIADGAITAAKIAANAITAAKIADGAIDAATFASGALDGVWSTATRVLTAGTNIVLAKGTGVTGFNDLDAAGVRSAVGLASADLDTQLGAIASAIGTIDGVVDAILVDTGTSIPSDLGTIAAALVTIDGKADAILLDTGTDIPAALAAIDSVVDTIVVTTDKLDDTLEDDGGTYRFTANALEEAPSGSGATAQEVWEYTTRELTEPVDVGSLEAAALEAVGDAVWDEAVDGSLTARESVRLINSAAHGKASGLETTTAVYRDVADSKARITATVDEHGNRSAVTRDAS